MKRPMFKMAMVICFLALAAQAHAFAILPTSGTLNVTRWEGNQTGQSQIDDALNALFAPDPVELYKQDVGGGESGLTGSYETTFSPPVEPSGATITYTGGTIVGPTAYLLVKDGNETPAWYFYDLTALGWDGMAILELSGFWPDQGSISHVSLYGTPGTPIPEPGTMMLLGSGLVGLAGWGRKKFRK